MAGINADGLVYSEHYAETMNGEVLPYLDARRTDMTLAGDGGRPLFASRFDADAPVGTALIVHGFTENVEKFAELIHSLLKNGLSVLAYDQRGHGRSWRAEGLSDLSLTHVDAFEEYARDMDAVCGQALADMPKPHRVLCHSMGGAVTAMYLENHPGTFDRAAMCSPMIAPNLGGAPKSVIRLLCRWNKARGRAKKRVFAFKPYAGPEDFATACATGRERFEWYEALRGEHPEFTNNSPSYSWLLESIDITDKLLAPGAVERIDTKVRLYTAANDTMVLPKPQKAFIDRVRDGEHVYVENVKHEIFRSADAELFPWWRDVLAFILN